MKGNNAYFKRKEMVVLKDFETAFTCYSNTLSKISNIRQWTVTIMVGLLVVLLTSVVSYFQVYLLAALILFVFILLELRERSSLKFNKKQIHYLEQIFQLKDEEDYWKKIDSYEFRDLRLKKFGRKKKIKHLFRSAKDLELLIWGGFWVLMWIAFGVVKHFANSNH